jgi:NADPH-dependent curcumin reductase CurA
MGAMNRQIRLKSRPTGEPTAENFEAVDGPSPDARDGDVVRRTIYLSLDPYMRGRMSDAPSYAAPVKVGDVMVGHTVSQVVESRNPDFTTGDFVTGYDGWQTYGISNGKELRKLDPKAVPISTAIGVLGMPGMTAFVGLMDIGQPKPGETVVVSAASGAVGAVVGQLAKIKGCRAVGIAGSPDKCRYVVDELGFDACVNYKTDDLVPALKAACPDGVDVYFENVGGAVFAAILRLINKGARIPLCGIISEYNATGNPSGPNLRPLLVQRATIKGFIVSDHPERAPAFVQEVAPLVMTGRIKFREDIVDGLDNAPSAFIGLLAGKNFGKLMVRVSPDPTRA